MKKQQLHEALAVLLTKLSSARDNAQAVNEIKCAQPQTVTVPYQPFQAVPNCIAYQYGMYNGCNNLNGFWL